VKTRYIVKVDLRIGDLSLFEEEDSREPRLIGFVGGSNSCMALLFPRDHEDAISTLRENSDPRAEVLVQRILENL